MLQNHSLVSCRNSSTQGLTLESPFLGTFLTRLTLGHVRVACGPEGGRNVTFYGFLVPENRCSAVDLQENLVGIGRREKKRKSFAALAVTTTEMKRKEKATLAVTTTDSDSTAGISLEEREQAQSSDPIGVEQQEVRWVSGRGTSTRCTA